jgi:hypothetical protein
LADLGYPQDVIDRVQALVRKERLKRDREVQVLEDVVCVVFLAHYLADFAAKHESDKVVEILRKTWAKMSPLGRRAALALPFDGALAGRGGFGRGDVSGGDTTSLILIKGAPSP